MDSKSPSPGAPRLRYNGIKSEKPKKRVINHMKKKTQRILFLVAAGLIAFGLWQNNDLVVSSYTYQSPRIPPELDGFTIAQLSDLHGKAFRADQGTLLSRLFAVGPDLIVLTGDLVDERQADFTAALTLARGAVDIAPVFFITGNHEAALPIERREELLEALERAGVTLLDDSSRLIRPATGGAFYLTGLSSDHRTDETLADLLNGQATNRLRVLLAHEPQYLEHYREAGADLVFSGHAHGGQFRLPGLGGLVAPGQGFFPKYTSGLYTSGPTTLVVSRGLGNSILPVRIFNRPQIVAVTFRSP